MKKPNRDAWAKAHIRASAGKLAKYYPRQMARGWIGGLQDVCDPNLPQETVNSIHDQLHRSMITEVIKALNTGNADFFRDFADALETKGRNWCRVRMWLANKHHPGPPPLTPQELGLLSLRDLRLRRKQISTSCKIPRFTYRELLDDARANGIKTSLRQLTRLMAEFGFRYKHSRRK